MISSWYVPDGFCFPFGSKYSVTDEHYKEKGTQNYTEKFLKICNENSIFNLFCYSYENL